jgi:hypothetical protein
MDSRHPKARPAAPADPLRYPIGRFAPHARAGRARAAHAEHHAAHDCALRERGGC